MLDVTTDQGSLLSLPLSDTSNGFVLQKVDGLDPVKATLSSTGFAGLDGEQFQSARRETRNIKVTLGYDPDPLVDTIRTLRKRLYGFFMPKSQITLTFYMDDGLTVSIAGVVESLETTIFDQEPSVAISIICYDPDFKVTTSTTLSGNTTESSAQTVVEYDGEVDTGFVFTLNVNRTMTDVTIYHTTPQGKTYSLIFTGSLVSGDVLSISTVTGDKWATLTHLGTSSSVLYGVDPSSVWLNIKSGTNKLRVYAAGAAVPYTIQYTVKYGGL
jgi:hypothetical protein